MDMCATELKTVASAIISEVCNPSSPVRDRLTAECSRRICASERYLPFEGSGAVSEWQLELPSDIRQFNYDTISDVILHVRYTAREGGTVLRNAAVGNLKAGIEEAQMLGSVRLFSVRHEFPSAWAKFKSAQNGSPWRELSLDLREEHYPFWSKGSLEEIKRVDIYARTAKASVEVNTSTR